MKDIRDWTYKEDGIASTITTVGLDRMIVEFYQNNRVCLGAAMRGRYNSDGKVEQKIELNGEEISNAITTANKDSLVVEVKSRKEE